MKQRTPEIGAQTRAQIAESLPQAIEKALDSYHNFIDNPDRKESGQFKDHHTAAKAALAHIELLLKLAAMVDIVEENKANVLCDLIKNARVELEKGNA